MFHFNVILCVNLYGTYNSKRFPKIASKEQDSPNPLEINIEEKKNKKKINLTT